MKIISKLSSFLVIFVVILWGIFASDNGEEFPTASMDHIGNTGELYPYMSYEVEDYSDGWTTEDMDNNGVIDYAIKLDESGMPMYEANDFNKDGTMDDFYIYSEGILIIQQIDANFDSKVDLWVFLKDGIYVTAFEQDKNFDGIIDIVKLYGQE